jgi:membrane fusion protein (multidrug efflux system)
MAEPVRKTVSPVRDEIAEAPRTTPVAPVAPAPVAPVEKRGKDRGKVADKGRKVSRRKRLRWVLFALLPIALIAGAYWYVTGGAVMSTDDAYVNAQKVGVSTDVSGIVQDVSVHDNEHVSVGQTLYRLDPRQFQIALDNAKANLAQVAQMLDSMKEDYKRMLSDVTAQQAQVDLDKTNFDRAQRSKQRCSWRGSAAMSTRRRLSFRNTCRHRHKSPRPSGNSIIPL